MVTGCNEQRGHERSNGEKTVSSVSGMDCKSLNKSEVISVTY